MIATWRIILAIFVLAAMFSTMVICTLGFPTTSTKLLCCFSLIYWCWYSYWCWLTSLMVPRVHVALRLRLNKLWKNLCWYLQVYGLVYIFLATIRKLNIVAWKRKNLKAFLDFILLVSFKFYFIISEDWLSISTKYYLFLWIYVVMIVKKKSIVVS
jgi:hypothetical protein